MRRVLLGALLAALTLVGVGCEVGTVSRVVDGDTIEVGDVTVRVIGIDAPEEGECGYAEAKARMSEIVMNREVVLGSDPGTGDADSYGRKLRYVLVGEANGTSNDVGLVLIREGHAHARYDGFDGYGAHRNQNSYRFSDGVFNGPCDPPATAPQPSAPQQPTGQCHPSYSPCLPVKNDINCPQIGHKVRVLVAGIDPYELDADGDGIGCQSYPDPLGW